MSLREFVLDNFKWKLASLVLAAATWLGISYAMRDDQRGLRYPLTANETRTFTNQPITVITSATDNRLFKITPQSVNVTVRSSTGATRVDDLTPGDIEAFVKLIGVSNNETTVPVQVYRPNGVTVVRIEPRSVRVVRNVVETQPEPVNKKP